MMREVAVGLGVICARLQTGQPTLTSQEQPVQRRVDTISKRLILGSGLTVAITAKM